jgi:hypothetical protein
MEIVMLLKLSLLNPITRPAHCANMPPKPPVKEEANSTPPAGIPEQVIVAVSCMKGVGAALVRRGLERNLGIAR